MYQVGGTFSSKERVRGKTVTIHGIGSAHRLKLRFKGKSEHPKIGPVFEYEVTEVMTVKPKGRR